jgi:hypothetical protein
MPKIARPRGAKYGAPQPSFVDENDLRGPGIDRVERACVAPMRFTSRLACGFEARVRPSVDRCAVARRRFALGQETTICAAAAAAAQVGVGRPAAAPMVKDTLKARSRGNSSCGAAAYLLPVCGLNLVLPALSNLRCRDVCLRPELLRNNSTCWCSLDGAVT